MICKMFVGLENVILRMMFVTLSCSQNLLLCFVESASFLSHFVHLQVCVFFGIFACRMMFLHRIILIKRIAS